MWVKLTRRNWQKEYNFTASGQSDSSMGWNKDWWL